jgi:Tfp pilus assembly protein PilV
MKLLRQQGFALLETLIVTSMFVFSFVAVNKAQTNMVKGKELSRQQTRAVQLGNQKLEQLRNYSTPAGYTNITNGSDTVTGGNTTYTRSWTVTPLTNYKRVDATVSWTTSGNQNQSIAMSSMISQNDPKYSGNVFSSVNNAAPLPTPGSTPQQSGSGGSGSGGDSGTGQSGTTEVTVPNTNIVLTYVNGQVTQINNYPAITWSGTVSLGTGGNAPASGVTLAAVTVVPQTNNGGVITCTYSGVSGAISCYMSSGWAGSIFLGGVSNTKVCVNGSQPLQPYSSLTTSLTNQTYQLIKSNRSCSSPNNILLQTL